MVTFFAKEKQNDRSCTVVFFFWRLWCAGISSLDLQLKCSERVAMKKATAVQWFTLACKIALTVISTLCTAFEGRFLITGPLQPRNEPGAGPVH